MARTFTHGILIGVGITLLSLASITYAASGGLFGDILAKMLGISSGQIATYNGDGTVWNSSSLGGTPAADFQRVGTQRSCTIAGQCIYGYDATTGNALCR